MLDLKTYIEFKIKNSKGLLSELQEKYKEYLKYNEEKENPIKKHIDGIKEKINFGFYKKKGNILDIDI
ncbi:MAG TPA: hypothetical protein PKW55_02670 [Spirochaetota bacterium]|nr:hypothetical protein [Spirochaetota bacterium]HOM38248.1 hypothetical protein [Spirochaetota bacterium]HPQ48534.1 hypothetical protein [Spirochaetota bacterium]